MTALKPNLTATVLLMMDYTESVIGSYGGRFFLILLPPLGKTGFCPLSKSDIASINALGNSTSIPSREL